VLKSTTSGGTQPGEAKKRCFRAYTPLRFVFESITYEQHGISDFWPQTCNITATGPAIRDGSASEVGS